MALATSNISIAPMLSGATRRARSNDAMQPQISTGGATFDSRAAWIASRFLRLARDLVAKRAVERYVNPNKATSRRRRRDKSALRIVPGFEQLACCAEHAQLRENVVQVEQDLHQSDRDLHCASWARQEDVRQLSEEVLHLQRQLCQSIDEGTEGKRLLEEAQELQRQLEVGREEIDNFQQEAAQARLEIQQHELTLSALRDAHEQEIAALRLRIHQESLDGTSSSTQRQDQHQRQTQRMSQKGPSVEQCCAQLHGPASRFLQSLGQEPLAPLPHGCAEDASVHVEWLPALISTIGALRPQ